MTRRPLATWAVAAVLLAGCASASLPQRQPEALDDGVQATGRLAGGRVAVSDGSPDTNLGDCDPGIEIDSDVCWTARTIDGLSITFVVENPAALVPGETIPVRDDDCDTCDDVTEHAVIDLRVEGEQRRASSGRLEVAEAGDRYAARFEIRFRDADQLNGRFNIRQLAPDER